MKKFSILRLFSAVAVLALIGCSDDDDDGAAPSICDNSTLAVEILTDGSQLTANATGGAPPYSYVWSSGENESTIIATEADMYTVTVTDNENCTAQASIDFEADGCGGESTVEDVEGNVYEIVEIAGRCWMAENLKTSSYENGNEVPLVEDTTAWENLNTGAYSWHGDDPSNDELYGKLYNWYAVVDARNLCPEGWRVPTDAEWSAMITSLDDGADPNAFGVQSIEAGGALKSVDGWNGPNVGATNSSGFTALPGSGRGSFGNYLPTLGTEAFFWTDTDLNVDNALYRSLNTTTSNVSRVSTPKGDGLSVRCIKD